MIIHIIFGLLYLLFFAGAMVYLAFGEDLTNGDKVFAAIVCILNGYSFMLILKLFSLGLL